VPVKQRTLGKRSETGQKRDEGGAKRYIGARSKKEQMNIEIE
jgi:hypothetical protein